MDHNLDDSLNLESTMGEMDFESADVVVSQADISEVPSSHDGDMNMEFEHIEEQPILMDSSNEEIIVSDFMEDQFNLQEYSIQDDQTSEMTTVEDSNLSARSESMIDLQFETQNVTQSIPEAKGPPQYIAVRAAPSTYPFTTKQSKATMLTTIPGQVAIAPKPPKLVPITSALFSTSQNKQVAIAPKPVTLTTNKTNFVKKVPLSSVVQGGGKGNAVLAQIGKQLVMMPPGSSQKIKLLPASNPGVVQYIKAAGDQAQLIPNQNVGAQQINKPVMAKVIQLQGQESVDMSNQPAVITKIVPTSTSNMQQTRYIMQTKTVPISIGNKVIMASPTRQGVKYTKKQQVLTLKSPTTKLMPIPAITAAGPPKKVLISKNPSQNVILKTTAPPKTAQVTKDGKVIVQGQRSQLHQINIPGKGVQYIRLISSVPPTSTVTKPQSTGASGPSKTFVVSDGKGNLVPVSAAKTTTGQQQFILKNARPTDKWPQKLMKIAAAPVSVKSVPVSQPVTRSSQSLLAPLSPVDMEKTADFCVKQEQSAVENIKVEIGNENTVDTEEDDRNEDSSDGDQDSGSESEDDSKIALQQLLATSHDIRHGIKQPQNPVETETADNVEDSEARPQDQPFIVISSNYVAQDNVERESQDDSNIDAEVVNNFLEPRTTEDLMAAELAFKPRRACNCTKSQCLKLYCDCFANGEFCNTCNCHNCYNNLDHEDLRQRAIRACLERNPNAFRPKIGKTKAGGPEIIRRHNKGCNCKRSGCLKNYCECYEAKIACTAMCKCVGCRNVEDARARSRPAAPYRPPAHGATKQPCTFMTNEVIEAVCQCLLAAAVDPARPSVDPARPAGDRARDVLDEFGRCLQDIIGAAHHQLLEQGRA